MVLWWWHTTSIPSSSYILTGPKIIYRLINCVKNIHCRPRCWMADCPTGLKQNRVPVKFDLDPWKFAWPSLHSKHRPSGPRPVKLCSLQAIKVFSFFKELYKNKLKNLIRTSKFKFSFRGLSAPRIICCDTGTKIVI